jgi:hypothetical protein
MNRSLVVLLLAVAFLLATGAHFYPDYDRARILQFLIISQITFLLSVAIYWVARPLDLDRKYRRLFGALVTIALLSRLVMLVGSDAHTYLSDDVFRYVWDGRVNVSGVNPYLYPPSAPELEELRDAKVYKYVNNKHLPTIYPPLAQNFFALSYLLDNDSPRGFKTISALMELLTALALAALLRLYQVPRANLLIYLFAPLVMIEFYMSSHVDILAMPFLVAALITLHRRKPAWTGVLLGLAAMVKFPALIFAPVLFFYFAGRKRVHFVFGCVAAVILCYVPYAVGSDWRFLGSLGIYLRDWQFNASIYFLLKYGLGLSWARPAVAVLFAALLVYLILRRIDIRSKLFASYAGHLCLTPTFYPWYFVWLYPLLCWNVSVPFLFLSGTTLLSYHVLLGYFQTGQWHPNIPFGAALYIVFYGLLIWWAIRSKASRENAAANER